MLLNRIKQWFYRQQIQNLLRHRSELLASAAAITDEVGDVEQRLIALEQEMASGT